MRLIIFLVAVTLASTARAEIADWHYVSLGKGGPSWPAWRATYGKASVVIVKNKVTITAFHKWEPMPNSQVEYDPEPSVIFNGEIKKDGSVIVTARYQNTDADPVQLKGKYFKHVIHRLMEGKRVVETKEEIVFPYPQNYEFYGVSVLHFEDEK